MLHDALELWNLFALYLFLLPTYSVDSHIAVIGRALPLGLQHDVYGVVPGATCPRESPAWLSTQLRLLPPVCVLPGNLVRRVLLYHPSGPNKHFFEC